MIKLEIGLKFEGSDFESPGFFRRGEICASLNFDGKIPWVKDKLAKRAMRIEKVSEHDFNKEAAYISNVYVSCSSFLMQRKNH